MENNYFQDENGSSIEEIESQMFSEAIQEEMESVSTNEFRPEDAQPILTEKIKPEENKQLDNDSSIENRKSYTSKLKEDMSVTTDNFNEIFYEVFFNAKPIMPIGTKELFGKFHEAIAEAAIKQNVSVEEIVKRMRDNLDDEKQLIFARALQSIDSLNEYGMGDIVKNEDPINEISYGGRDQNIYGTKIKPSSEKPSPDYAFGKFQAILGLGVASVVVLYHSGFTVAFNPPTQAELLKLQVEIFTTDQELGYSTSGYFNTAKKSRVIAILKEYLQSKMIAHTLDVSKEDVFDYISLLDFDAMLLGILKGAFDYISVVKFCYNIIDPDSEAKRCTNGVSGRVNPAKLNHISRTMLNDNMLMTLAKRNNGSVSLPEQQNYIINLDKKINEKRNRRTTYTFKVSEDIGYEVEFKVPTVNEYIKASEEWIFSVESQLDALMEANNDISRESAKETVDIITKVSSISSGIKNIKVYNRETNASEIFDDNQSIMKIVQGKSVSYDEFIPRLQEEYVEFMNKSPITYVATPAYRCPSCKKLVEDDNELLRKEKLIGFNLVDFFFSVVEYQKSIAKVRQQLG